MAERTTDGLEGGPLQLPWAVGPEHHGGEKWLTYSEQIAVLGADGAEVAIFSGGPWDTEGRRRCRRAVASVNVLGGYAEPEMVLIELDELRRALRAVLMFHSPGPWTQERIEQWAMLGVPGGECTTRAVCDMARAALSLADTRNPPATDTTSENRPDPDATPRTP